MYLQIGTDTTKSGTRLCQNGKMWQRSLKLAANFSNRPHREASPAGQGQGEAWPRTGLRLWIVAGDTTFFFAGPLFCCKSAQKKKAAKAMPLIGYPPVPGESPRAEAEGDGVGRPRRERARAIVHGQPPPHAQAPPAPRALTLATRRACCKYGVQVYVCLANVGQTWRAFSGARVLSKSYC